MYFQRRAHQIDGYDAQRAHGVGPPARRAAAAGLRRLRGRLALAAAGLQRVRIRRRALSPQVGCVGAETDAVTASSN